MSPELRPLFGVETEYAMVAIRLGGELASSAAAGFLLGEAAELPSLPHREGGLVLENGGRLYVDHGAHPELATPECTDPLDVVRYVLAGEELLAELAARVEARQETVVRARLYKTNVDYDAGVTWGCHESYLHRAPWSSFASDLVPHLVTRLVFTGAGGFDPRHPGIRFTLSPRSHFIERIVSESSVGGRGILHSKDEPLAGPGFGRLHVLFGESLCSQVALWLKVGTTALVVAMVEAGRNPGHAVRLRSPLEAIRAVAADPGCRGPLPLESGRRATAIEIQRHLLEEAERFIDDGGAPDWGAPLCRTWRSTLGALERDPACQARTLDWCLKRAIYEDRLRRRDLTWSTLEPWNRVLSRLAELERSAAGAASAIERARSRLRDSAARRALARELELHGENWDRLDDVVVLRAELFETDMRLAELGKESLFQALDRQGLLRHRLPELGSIQRARSEPPRTTRARVRGRAVREGAGRGAVQCDWTAVWDTETGRRIDLSNPFTVGAEWRPAPDSTQVGHRRDEILEWAELSADPGYGE